MAVNNLHVHIMEKLHGVKELLAYENDEKLAAGEELSEAVISSVTIDSLVIGVLEEAFFEMVSLEASGDIYISCEQVLLCSRTKRNGELKWIFKGQTECETLFAACFYCTCCFFSSKPNMEPSCDKEKSFLTWEESILCFEDQQQTWVILVCLSYWVCGDKQ